MTTPTSSFRLPAETLERLRTLARPGESLASVIVRAARALEASPALAGSADRLGALEARVAQLEACIAAVAQLSDSCVTTAIQAPSERITSVAQDPQERVTPVLQDRTSAAVQEVLTLALEQGFAAARPGRPGDLYPAEVRRMALDMDDRGEPAAQIRAAVLKACGREPGAKNWSTTKRAWRKAARD